MVFSRRTIELSLLASTQYLLVAAGTYDGLPARAFCKIYP